MSEKANLKRIRAVRGGNRAVITKLTNEARDLLKEEQLNRGRLGTINDILNEKAKIVKDLDEKDINECEVNDIGGEIEEAEELKGRVQPFEGCVLSGICSTSLVLAGGMHIFKNNMAETLTESEYEFESILEDSFTNEARENESELSMEGLESVAGCECRSQCSRKLKTSSQGKVTGCPCKGNGLMCGEHCKCGTKSKPCKNKTEDTRQAGQPGIQNNLPGNQNNLPVNELSVEDLLAPLTPSQVLEVAKKGFQSRLLELQDIIASVSESTHENEPPRSVPNYCICGHCRPMPTSKEELCCKEKKKCRAKLMAFHNICLESENISTVIRNMADTYVFTPTYDNRAMRHAAYRQYIMWQHGYLGKGNRKVIPSCCVWEIRKHYPSPDGHYTGYKN